MPFEFTIDSEKQRVNTSIVGDFTTEEMFELLHEVTQHPDYVPAMDILSDHTQIGEPLTADQAVKFASYIKTIDAVMANTRWAVVTVKSASFGMMRLLSVRVEHVPITLRVFKTFQEAELWLLKSKNESTK